MESGLATETQLPTGPPIVSASDEDVTCEIWDLGTHRVLHMSGPHYGTCGLVQESLIRTESSVEWLFDLFRLKGLWTANEVLRAEGFVAESTLDYFSARYHVDLNGANVLELGCGLGASAVQMLRRGAQSLVAMDIDASGLTMARRRVTDFGYRERASFIEIGQDGQLPVKDQAFDIVAAFEVFEHVTPCLRPILLRALYKKLRPGGTLLLSTPNRIVPKDLHTSGLWFVNYMPRSWAFAYARLASRRCRGQDNVALISAGLLSFSWREAVSVLRPLGAVDLSLTLPPQPEHVPSASRAGKAWNKAMKHAWSATHRVWSGVPFDAVANHLFLAFMSPQRTDQS